MILTNFVHFLSKFSPNFSEICPFLSRNVHFYPILSFFYQFCPILSHFVQISPILSTSVQFFFFFAIMSNSVQIFSISVQFCPFLSNFVPVFPFLSNFVYYFCANFCYFVNSYFLLTGQSNIFWSTICTIKI